MAKPKLTVTLPDGTVATRSTDREYTHVLAVRGGQENVWRAESWHGSEYQALRARDAFVARQARATYECGPGEHWYVEPGSPRVLPVDGTSNGS